MFGWDQAFGRSPRWGNEFRDAGLVMDIRIVGHGEDRYRPTAPSWLASVLSRPISILIFGILIGVSASAICSNAAVLSVDLFGARMDFWTNADPATQAIDNPQANTLEEDDPIAEQTSAFVSYFSLTPLEFIERAETVRTSGGRIVLPVTPQGPSDPAAVPAELMLSVFQ